MIKNNIGRPVKVNYKILARLEEALENGANVTKACKYAGISRETFYRYFKNEDVFAERIRIARRRSLVISLPDFCDILSK